MYSRQIDITGTSEKWSSAAKCTVFGCENPEKAEVTPKLNFCAMNVEKATLVEAAKEYEKPKLRTIAKVSALVESNGDMK